MSVKNIITLLIHDLRMCLKGLLVFQLFLAPLSLWLIIYLVFGQMAIGDPKIGLLENENSILVQPFYDNAEVSRFSGKEEMLGRLENGKLDMAIVLSPGFDTAMRSGEEGTMSIYISGTSPLQRRVQAFVFLQSGVVLLQEREPVVNITVANLGDADIAPWYYRLLPLVVLIAVMMGGIFIPATSIIDDKQRKTIQALLAAPVNIHEVIWAKMLLGGLISFLMGLMILALNQSLGVNPVPLLTVLVIVALSASCFGCIIGYVSGDMKSVTTITQSLMLLMYAPAILNIFPQIPGWVQKLFPTYYFFSPLLKLSDRTFAVADAWEIAVLFGILGVVQLALFIIIRKRNHSGEYVALESRHEPRANV
jgi:ABC-2 type transport system permease protein